MMVVYRNGDTIQLKGLKSAVYILPSVCILPLVCSSQSAFYTDRPQTSKTKKAVASHRITVY